MASGFNFYPFLLIRLYLLESVRVCTLLKTVHSTPGKSDKTNKKSDNWIKIELFSVLSVFFFSSYFLFRNHFCPFFVFLSHAYPPTTFHFSRLEGLSQWWISQKDFKRLPYVRERNSTIWIFILIKSSKSISCFQEHITVVPSNTYSTSVVLVLYLLAQT